MRIKVLILFCLSLAQVSATNYPLIIKAILRHYKFNKVRLVCPQMTKSEISDINLKFGITLSYSRSVNDLLEVKNFHFDPGILCLNGDSVIGDGLSASKTLGSRRPFFLIGSNQSDREYSMNKINPLLNQEIYFVQEDSLCLYEKYFIATNKQQGSKEQRKKDV